MYIKTVCKTSLFQVANFLLPPCSIYSSTTHNYIFGFGKRQKWEIFNSTKGLATGHFVAQPSLRKVEKEVQRRTVFSSHQDLPSTFSHIYIWNDFCKYRLVSSHLFISRFPCVLAITYKSTWVDLILLSPTIHSIYYCTVILNYPLDYLRFIFYLTNAICYLASTIYHLDICYLDRQKSLGRMVQDICLQNLYMYMYNSSSISLLIKPLWLLYRTKKII